MTMEIAIKSQMDQEEDVPQSKESKTEIRPIPTKKLSTRREDYLQIKNTIKKAFLETREGKALPNGNKVKMTNKMITKE